MSVNGVDNFSIQEHAVGLSQAAANALQEVDKKYEQTQVDDRNFAQKLSDSKSAGKQSKQILGDLVAKLAGSGIKIDPEQFMAKAQRSGKDEYDMMLQTRDNTTDSTDLISVSQKITSVKKQSKNNREGGQENQQDTNPQKLAGTTKEYTAAFVSYLVSGGTELKKKVEQLELKLKSEGMTEKELLGLQQGLRQSIRSQLASNIKEAFMKRFFSKEKSLEWVMNNKEGYKSIEFAFNSEKLGGWDFGGYNESLQGTVDKQLSEIRGEVKDFVSDELKTSLVRKHLEHPNADNDIKELIKLGLKAGFDAQQFLASWKQDMHNIGITPPPPEAYGQSMMGSSMDKNNQERTGYEFTQEDEKDLLMSKLRALYLQRAVHGNMRVNIETSFKIRKLKNGLIKLGIAFADFEKLESEGKTLGRIKLLEMIKEAYCERSTLYELSGPAFQLIETRIKGLMKNLERLGVELTKTDLDSIRDQANYKMFDVARAELENSIILYESRKSPTKEKKIKLVIKLMNRLKEESNIDTDFDPSVRYNSIGEAA